MERFYIKTQLLTIFFGKSDDPMTCGLHFCRPRRIWDWVMTAHADWGEGYTRQSPRAPNSPVNSPAILLHDPLYGNGLISISIGLPPWMTLLNICWMKEGIPLQSYNCLETEDDASSLTYRAQMGSCYDNLGPYSRLLLGWSEYPPRNSRPVPTSCPTVVTVRVDVATAVQHVACF